MRSTLSPHLLALATDGMLFDRRFKAQLEQNRATHNIGKLPFASGVLDMYTRQLMGYTECTHYFYEFEVTDRSLRETSREEERTVDEAA